MDSIRYNKVLHEPIDSSLSIFTSSDFFFLTSLFFLHKRTSKGKLKLEYSASRKKMSCFLPKNDLSQKRFQVYVFGSLKCELFDKRHERSPKSTIVTQIGFKEGSMKNRSDAKSQLFLSKNINVFMFRSDSKTLTPNG